MTEGFPTNFKLRLGAALFNADHGHLADEVIRLEGAGLDFIHLDVYDGHFVSDVGFSPRTISTLRVLSKLPFEVHLGAVNPLRFVPPLAEAGADAVICHIECIDLVHEFIVKLRAYDMRVGLALSLGTQVEALKPVLVSLDTVLLLSRATGEGSMGASFDPAVLPRVSAIRAMAESTKTALDIQAAGGIKREHVADLVQAGATSLTLGGGLYRAANMKHEVIEIRELANRRAQIGNIE